MTLPLDIPSLLAIANAWRVVAFSNNCPALNDIAERSRVPQIGDLVFEVSRFRRQDDPDAIGYLRAVETCDGEAIYTIETLDGQRRTWANASFIAIPTWVGR
jgi:hypothetical protein